MEQMRYLEIKKHEITYSVSLVDEEKIELLAKYIYKDGVDGLLKEYGFGDKEIKEVFTTDFGMPDLKPDVWRVGLPSNN